MRSVTLRWVGGEHPFSLRLGALRALQEKTNRGPEELLNRIRLGTWHIDELRHVLTEGLVDAGMPAADARRLVVDSLETHPPLEAKLTANAVLAFALVGDGDDPVGKPAGETPPPENGVSPASTETAP